MPHTDAAGGVAWSEEEVQNYLDKHKIKEMAEDAFNECIKAEAEDPRLFMSNFIASHGGGTVNEKKIKAMYAAWSSGKLSADGKEAVFDGLFEASTAIRHASKFESRKGLSVWSDAAGRDQCLAFFAKLGDQPPALVKVDPSIEDGVRYVRELEAGTVLVKHVATYMCHATGKKLEDVVSMQEWSFGASGKIALCLDSHNFSQKIDAIFEE